MPRRHIKLLFSIALTASLLVHASLLLLLGMSVARSQRQIAMQRSDPVVLLMPPELQLGIDAQTPPSETWLGFDKPQPQAAPPSVIDQAAFTEDPIAAAPQPPSPPPAPPEMENPTEPVPAPKPPSPPVDSETPQPEQQNQTPAENPSKPAPSLTENELASFTQLLESLGVQSPSDQKTPPVPRETAPPPPPPPAPAADASPSESASTTPKPEQAVAPHPVSGAPNDGVQSDKDSSASSIIDVPRDQWQRGKPVAAHGLELKPQRPEFTVLTMLTAAPANPLCLIKFGRDGVPVKADLVESSGDSRVDEAIKASLYRWRASGKELARLGKDETADVTMRIILSRNRHS